MWELPKLQSGWAPLRYVLNDWQTNGIFQYRTGDALTILSSAANNSLTGQNRDRAVFLGGAAYGSQACSTAKTQCVGFLNPGAFAVNPVPTPSNPNPPLRYGNVRKGSFTGPEYADWDVSLMRHFRFTERWSGEFRAEYFNVLNHPNFMQPSNTLGGSFGRITGAMDPRIGQLSFKVFF